MMKTFFPILCLTVAFLSNGCGAVTDPIPNSPAPVWNVEQYYLPLKNIGASITYCRKTQTTIDTIKMTMQGNDDSGLMLGNQYCYTTDLSKTNSRLFDYYFTMNDSEAYTLGKLSCGQTDKYWLDLKAPLTVGQTWSFSNSNGSYYVTNTYTAKVTRRGVTMKMPDGKVYDDVAEIIYASKSGDTTVKWFAKGTGLIYSTSKNPDSDFGKEMRIVNQ
ncbi:MAG: hypothetical protein WCH46_07995 [bacterium]